MAKFTVDDVKRYAGFIITVQGRNFELNMDYDCGGTWAAWYSDGYTVLATPNYECNGVPVDMREPDGTVVACDSYRGDVEDFDMYVDVVRVMINTLLTDILSKEDKNRRTIVRQILGWDTHNVSELKYAITRNDLDTVLLSSIRPPSHYDVGELCKLYPDNPDVQRIWAIDKELWCYHLDTGEVVQLTDIIGDV